MNIKQLHERHVLKERPLPRTLELQLRDDPRPGVRQLLAQIEKRRAASRAEGQRLRHMLRYERALWAQSITLVAGVDEAGMSPLAGPVVAGAVILPVECKLEDVDDSKKLDAATRERLAHTIKSQALWAVGIVEVEEIDRLNIYHAGLLAMHRAVQALSQTAQALLVDARKLKDIPVPQQAIIGGDGKSLSIAAASIIAKTTRDALMVQLDQRYPGYGFARHKGYGVPAHYDALRQLGCSPIHRRSFPIIKPFWR